VSCAKVAEPIEMLFGIWTHVGLQVHVLDGGTYWCHLGIRFNRQCAAVMRPYVKLLRPRYSVGNNGPHLRT